jgi:hypothetical protein
MALTKLPKNAFAADSVDASKIEDGTIQAVEVSGTITEDKIATGTIANASLSNSSITINGSSVSLGGTINLGTAIIADVNWQSVQTTGFTAVAGNGYFVNTTSGAITVTLPASASIGDTIAIKDYAGTFGSNNLTIGRNGHNIQGVANDSLISTNRASLVLVYVDSTKGWIYAEESNVADLQVNSFIEATGGTVATSGDYKIHTFTGDGCFAVSTIGIGPSGGPNNVDYLVVAGGGGGGVWGGGGGAGGYRASGFGPAPLQGSSLSASITTYPITVGGGGTGQPGPSILTGAPYGTNGSDSIFSTITSSGGGAGFSYCGNAGGSGAGNCGTGNTPPTSPSQGNNGGTRGGFPGYGGGGGGGATAVGVNGSPSAGGAGGAGAPNAISGSALSYSGGGGGGGSIPAGGSPGGAGSPCGTGGAGTGNSSGTGTNGTTNRGGGGGSGGYAPGGDGGNGGSGIVIIRYKFQ